MIGQLFDLSVMFKVILFEVCPLLLLLFLNKSFCKVAVLFDIFCNGCTGRRGGLVVSLLDSRSRGPGSSPARSLGCVLGQNTLTVPLSTQEYKWVPANCQGNLMKC